MRTRVNFSSSYPFTFVTFTTRISSAIEMFNVFNLLETQQETEGVWDTFFGDLVDVMQQRSVGIRYTVDFFKGTNDVIFELKIDIQKYEECKDSVASEQIMGTIVSAVAKHFGWSGWTLNLDDPTSYENKTYKDLLVFKS